MNNFMYYQYNNSPQAQALQDKERADAFIKRIEPFKDIKTLGEAKDLAKKILPVKDDITSFFVGKLKCTVVNRAKSFRISVDNTNEFICYDFS